MTFHRYSWFVLGYNIAVVLWGAYVRATGSGAGCGRHWPLCNGEVVPRSPQLDTLIEFSHRATSGLALVLVAILVIWAWRTYPKRSPIRCASAAAGILIITEAVIGAGLVLFELVAGNTSVTRAFAGSLHLLNTFLLLAALTLVAYWSGQKELNRAQFRPDRIVLLMLAWVGILLIGMSGAITALGDTIFQTDTLMEGIALDLDRSANFLVRLRWIHPVIALIVSVYILLMVRRFQTRLEGGESLRSGWSLIGLVIIQLLVGPVNLLLLAPIGMQIVHLLLADLVWILLVIFSDDVLRTP